MVLKQVLTEGTKALGNKSRKDLSGFGKNQEEELLEKTCYDAPTKLGSRPEQLFQTMTGKFVFWMFDVHHTCLYLSGK